MDPAIVASVIISVAGIVGNQLLNRANNRAKAETDKIERRRVDNEGKGVDLSVLQAALARLEADVARLDGDLDEERELRRGEAQANAEWKRLALSYIHELRADLRAARVDVRQPPKGLELN